MYFCQYLFYSCLFYVEAGLGRQWAMNRTTEDLEFYLQHKQGNFLCFNTTRPAVVAKDSGGWSVKLTSHLRLVPRLNMPGAIPLLSPFTVRAYTGTNLTITVGYI
jgi:hypothetical protein